jgi:DNA primase
MAEAVAGAEPMVNLLWRRETEGRVFDSPERRAALDKTLRESIRRIADPSIRAHYGEEIKRLRWELFAAGRPPPRGGATRRPESRGQGFRPGAATEPLPGTRASLLAAAPVGDVEDYLREAMILAIAITHPGCVTRFEGEFETLHLRDAGHERLRHAVLVAAHDGGPASLREKVARAAGAELEKLFALAHVRIAPPVRNTDDSDFAAMCLAEELAKLEARRGMEAEVAEAMEDLAGLADEGLTWRLGQAAEARHRAERSKLDDDSDMGEDRGALSAGLQRLIDAAVWEKKKP